LCQVNEIELLTHAEAQTTVCW